MAWALVQTLQTTPSGATGSAITIGASFATNVTAGNRILLNTSASQQTASAADINTPTDNQGNTYTKLVSNESPTGGASVWRTFTDLWTAVVSSTGTLTITVVAPSGGAAHGELGWTAQEYSGLDASAGSGCLDVSATAAGNNDGTSTTSVSTGTTAATSGANQLALAIVGDYGGNFSYTAPSGFTIVTNGGIFGNGTAQLGVANKTSSSGATEGGTWTYGSSAVVNCALVAVIKLPAAAVNSALLGTPFGQLGESQMIQLLGY